MRTVTAKAVLNGAWARYAGQRLEDAHVEDFRLMRSALGQRLKQAWQYFAWPELMRVERRRYRAAYSSTAGTYAAGDEVYFIGTDTYYQALQANSFTSPQPPANYTGGTWVDNRAYWARCAGQYSANVWVTGTSYVVGDQVFYDVTGLYYQCHTAHTSSGVLTPDATGGSSRWGVLTAFNAYIALAQSGQTVIGTPWRVTKRDPRIFANAVDVGFSLSVLGVEVYAGPTQPWVQFRLPPPEVSGDAFDATLVYAAGAQMYYASTTPGFEGDFWNCVTTTVAGDTPEGAHAARWAKVEVPWIFERFLVQAVYDDLLKPDGQNDKAVVEQEGAVGLLAEQMTELMGQSGYYPRPVVVTS